MTFYGTDNNASSNGVSTQAADSSGSSVLAAADSSTGVESTGNDLSSS